MMMVFDLTTVPTYWLFAIAALLGAILTSFGRLAVYRLPHQMGWRDQPINGLTLCSPASHCDSCGQPVRLAYLLPIIGWLFTKGCCSDCGVRVSICHPVIEAIGALGWVIALSWFGLTAEGLAACLLWQVLLFLAEIDWRESWLPAVVTLPLFWAGLLLSPFAPLMEERALGGFAGFSLMWFCMAIVGRWRRQDLLAGGDIALSAAAGAWLGFAKVPQFLFIAATLFIMIALPARSRGQLMVPMGPALAASFLLCLGSPALLH